MFDDDVHVVPTCVDCGAELAPAERTERAQCGGCGTIACPCGERHVRGYRCEVAEAGAVDYNRRMRSRGVAAHGAECTCADCWALKEQAWRRPSIRAWALNQVCRKGAA